MKGDLRDRVVSSLRWQTAAKIGSQAISWGITIVVMRVLDPRDYGLMAMVTLVVGLAALLAELGLGAAIVQAREVDVEQQRVVFGLALVVNGGLFVVLAVAAPWVAATFDEQRLVLLMLVAAAQFPISAIGVVPDAMARRSLDFKSLSQIELATQLATGLSTLATALSGWGVWSLLVGQLVGNLLRCGMLWRRFGLVSPSFAFAGRAALLRFGGALTANRVMWYAYSQADTFIAGKLLGAQLLGIYSVAAHLASMPMQKMMAISNQVAFSAFSRLQHEPERLAASVSRTIRLSATLSVGLLWGLAALAPWLVPLLLGSKWADAVLPLQLIAGVVPLRVVAATLATACIAKGQVARDLRNNVVGLVVMAPAFGLGATQAGVMGLAMAWSLAYPLLFLWIVSQVASPVGLSVGGVLRELARPVLAGVLMVAAVALAGHALQAVPALPLGALFVICTATAAAAFFGAVAWLDRETLREARDLLRGPRPT